MRDIEKTNDIYLLIEHFYEKLVSDDMIGHFFQALDLSKHIPRVAEFWAFILIDQPGYSGNMIQVHAKLQLTESHFERWLLLFHETIDAHFQGEKASLAKERSTLIAWTMKSKL
jgi:hemoglobin